MIIECIVWNKSLIVISHEFQLCLTTELTKKGNLLVYLMAFWEVIMYWVPLSLFAIAWPRNNQVTNNKMSVDGFKLSFLVALPVLSVANIMPAFQMESEIELFKGLWLLGFG